MGEDTDRRARDSENEANGEERKEGYTIQFDKHTSHPKQIFLYRLLSLFLYLQFRVPSFFHLYPSGCDGHDVRLGDRVESKRGERCHAVCAGKLLSGTAA